ncbi:MAG: oxidoreductase, short chain dehydrogenase/reductase family [Gammaproteobacteria bacterium]|nr:oxidoreductase, short chain dehydrogenase/reductase family [Gammaproteobacteria bacterium]
MQKSILITGCSSGIGYCAAKTLHDRGYHVVAAVRKKEDKARLISEGFDSILLDINDSSSIIAGVEETLDKTKGQLYALFNNAGYGQLGAIEGISTESLRQQFETNVFGVHELTNAILPVMKKQGHGRIINVSSMLGLVVMAYTGAYAASKFAIEGLTDAFRIELRDSNILFSLIEPGRIKTKFLGNAQGSRDKAQALADLNKNLDKENSQNSSNPVPPSNAADKYASPLALGPEAVVQKLIHALESSNPRARYYVGFPTYLFAFLKRILPSKWLDAVMVKFAK